MRRFRKWSTINLLLEYLLSDNGDTMEFINEDVATMLLKTKGFTDAELYWLVFETVGKHYLKVGQYKSVTDESETTTDSIDNSGCCSVYLMLKERLIYYDILSDSE